MNGHRIRKDRGSTNFCWFIQLLVQRSGHCSRLTNKMNTTETEEINSSKDEESFDEKCNDDSINRTVFVYSLPYRMNWKKLKRFFSKFGTVVFTRAVSDAHTKRPKGYGFVQFKDIDGAKRALNAGEDELKVDDRILSVHAPDEKYRKSRNGSLTVPQNMLSNEVAKAEKETVPCEINKLSDDELVLVFIFLNPTERIAIERVCKRWRQCAIRAAKVQRHMVVKKNFKTFGLITESILEKMLSRCSPHLISLDFSQLYHHFGNKALKVIARCCPFVQRLDLSKFNCNNKGMKVLTSQCSNLKWLKIVGCLQVTNKGFCCIFKNCKHLEYLNCMGNSELTGAAFAFAQAGLKHLHLGNCRKLTVEGLEQLSSRCPNMETLNVQGCILLSYQSLRKVIQSFPNLKEVKVGSTQCTVNSSTSHLIKSLINPRLLVSLEVSTSGLLDSHLTFICESCPFLTDLDISCNRLTDSSVCQLSKLTQLQNLHACFLYNVTDSALLDVALLGNLRVLRIQGCLKLTDEFLIAVAENCLGLEEVDMAGVSLATVESLKAFSRTHKTAEGKKDLLIYILSDCNSRFMERSVTNFTEELIETVPRAQGMYIIPNYRPWYPVKLNWEGDSDEEAGIIMHLEIEIENAISSNPMFPTLDAERGGWSSVRFVVWSDDDSDDNEDDDLDGNLNKDPLPVEAMYEDYLLNDDPLAAEDLFDDYLYNDDPLAVEDDQDFLD